MAEENATYEAAGGGNYCLSFWDRREERPVKSLFRFWTPGEAFAAFKVAYLTADKWKSVMLFYSLRPEERYVAWCGKPNPQFFKNLIGE